MIRLVSTIAAALVLGFCVVSAAAAKAYPANVYFHFDDGHGNDFRIPLAIPGLTECNQAKLAVIAKERAKNDPLLAGTKYVRAECRAPRK